jgi:thiol-disulfide isomerase/thioredoxin
MTLKFLFDSFRATCAVVLVIAPTVVGQAPPAAGLSANQAQVKQLLDQVRLTEAWLDKIRSLLLEGTGTWTGSEGLSADELRRELDIRQMAHFPGQGIGLEAFADHLPKIEERIVIGWDTLRMLRINDKPGLHSIQSQWDGQQAVFKQSLEINHRDNVILDSSAHTFAGSLLTIDLNFGRADLRKTWWTPAISPQEKAQFDSTFNFYHYFREDEIDGKPQHVLGLPNLEWWIDGETKWLTKISAYQDAPTSPQAAAQLGEKRREYLRSNNVPVQTQEEEEKFFTQLAEKSPQELGQIQGGIRDYLTKAGMVKRILATEFLNKDWKTLAPGMSFPMTQITRYYPLTTQSSGSPFLEREIRFTDAKVNEPIPDSLFEIEIGEGTSVRDQGHDPPLIYAYKKDMPQEEMDRIISEAVQYDIQLKAQDEKRQYLLGKSPPPLSARFWVNSTPIDLSSLGGRAGIVYFWADYIPECQKDFVLLEEIHSLYSRYFQVIAVHTPVPMYRSFFELNVPMLVDNSAVEASMGTVGDTGFAYGIHRLPYAYLIAPNGTVDSHGRMQGIYDRAMAVLDSRPQDSGDPRAPAPRQAAPQAPRPAPAAQRPQPKGPVPGNLPPNVTQSPPMPTTVPIIVEPNP